METNTRELLKYNILLNEWFFINMETSYTSGTVAVKFLLYAGRINLNAIS